MRGIPVRRSVALLLTLVVLVGCNHLAGRHYFIKGERLYNAGKFPEAAAAFGAAIEKRYRLQESYAYRGLTHWEQGKYDLAIADNNAALAINPRYAPAYNGRGLAYYRKGEIDKTVADMELVLKYSNEQELREAAVKLLEALKTKEGTEAP